MVRNFDVVGNFGVVERVFEGGALEGGGGPVGTGPRSSVNTMLSAGTRLQSTASRQVIGRRISLFSPIMQWKDDVALGATNFFPGGSGDV